MPFRPSTGYARPVSCWTGGRRRPAWRSTAASRRGQRGRRRAGGGGHLRGGLRHLRSGRPPRDHRQDAPRDRRDAGSLMRPDAAAASAAPCDAGPRRHPGRHRPRPRLLRGPDPGGARPPPRGRDEGAALDRQRQRGTAAARLRRARRRGRGTGDLFRRALDHFDALYARHASVRSRLFPGVREGLDYLEAKGVTLACNHQQGRAATPAHCSPRSGSATVSRWW